MISESRATTGWWDKCQAGSWAVHQDGSWAERMVRKEGWIHFIVNFPKWTIKYANKHTYQIIH